MGKYEKRGLWESNVAFYHGTSPYKTALTLSQIWIIWGLKISRCNYHYLQVVITLVSGIHGKMSVRFPCGRTA